MNKMSKLTFKKQVATGRYRSFETEACDIKRNKNIVGLISEASHLSKVPCEERISIKFMVKDNSEKCGWKWITLKKKFEKMEDARQFVSDKSELIQKQFNLFELK